MIHPIPYKYVSSIVKQYETDGHSPYLILTEDLEKYVLKTCKNSFDKPSLIKEFLCTELLNCWGISTPASAVLSLSPELLDSPYVLNNNRFNHTKTFFGSELITDSIDLQFFISAKGKVPLRKISTPSILLDIALFDIWTENDDRKPTNNNLLLCPGNKGLLITPIDHALTFASMQINQLNPKFVSFSDNDSIAFSPLGRAITGHMKINAEWLAKAKEKFYLRTSETKESFQQICDNLPLEFRLSDEEKDKLSDFLFSEERNKLVFDQFSYIVNSIN